MGNYWVYLLLVGCFVVTVKGQAEAVFPGYYSLESVLDNDKDVKTEAKNDEAVNESDALDEENIDQVINSDIAEGLNGDFEVNGSNDDDTNQNDVEEVQNEKILNSDEAKVREEIESFRRELNGEGEFENAEAEPEDVDESLADYQFEDNRSEVKDVPRNPSDGDDPVMDKQDETVDTRDIQDYRNQLEFADGGPSAENVEQSEEIHEIIPDHLNENDFDKDPEEHESVKLNEDENNEESMEQAIPIEDQIADGGESAENAEQVEEIHEIIQDHLNENNFDEDPEVLESVKQNEDENNEESIGQAIPIEDQVAVNYETNDDQIAVNSDSNYEQFPGSDESNVDYEQVDYDGGELEQETFDYVDESPMEKNDQNLVKEEEVADNPAESNGEDNFYVQSNDDVKEYDETDDTDIRNDLEDSVNKSQADIEETIDIIQTNIEDTVNKVETDIEDTVDKVQADLDADMRHLFETWNKLYEDSADATDDDEDKTIDVAKYEQEYGKPYGEDTVLSQRDYDEGFEESDTGDERKLENVPLGDNYNVVEESISESNDSESKIEDPAIVAVSDVIEGGETNSNNISSVIDAEDNEEGGKNVSIERQILPQLSVNTSINVYDSSENSLEDENPGIEQTKNVIENESTTQIDIQGTTFAQKTYLPLASRQQIAVETSDVDPNLEYEPTTESDLQEYTSKSIKVSDLTSSQYDELMHNFAIVHLSDMNSQSLDFDKPAAPVHMTLNSLEPTVVTSPNYPDTYPTNNVIDWIFTGEGLGIEFNVTDLDLNGALGDYLLVKPGSLDESGSEGLIFSYQLTEPRQYRFLDVDRMFVRFLSNPAVEGKKGFTFSAKMVAAPENETLPDPEPLYPPGPTLTVYLGGTTMNEFQQNIREPFEQIVADMATVYVNTHGLDLDDNLTSPVTRLSAVSRCHLKWPSSTRCAKVTFGVTLDQDGVRTLSEEQLDDMWTTLLYVDPFAYRMRSLGVEEFLPPNDTAVLTSWLVIGAGVMISAAMLAFALWRFSCFEDYTRMSPFSDSDSIRDEKRDLDLYPTPHQTLPPLYSEDYHWADEDSTRVDIGGFTNRSFARDELFGAESEEEGSVPRDRYTSDV